MTNKITKEFLFTELSIKIATLEMKLDKILELLNSPQQEIIVNQNVDYWREASPEDYQGGFEVLDKLLKQSLGRECIK